MKKLILTTVLWVFYSTLSQSQTYYGYFAPGGALSCSGTCVTQSVNLAAGGSFITGTLPQGNLLTCAANQLVYDNATAILTCSTNLQFDGTGTLTIGAGGATILGSPSAVLLTLNDGISVTAPTNQSISLVTGAGNGATSPTVTVTAGNSGCTSGNCDAGAVTITAGTANATTSSRTRGGSVNLTAGNGVAGTSNNSPGGSVNLTAGSANGTGTGAYSGGGFVAIAGAASLGSTTASATNGGAGTFSGGAGGSSNTQANGGGFSFAGGNGGTGTGTDTGGAVSFTGGTGGTGTGTNSGGGAITLTAGSGGTTATNAKGGNITLKPGAAGASSSGGTADSGAILIQTSGGSNALVVDGFGNIYCTCNTSAASTDGFTYLGGSVGAPSGTPAHVTGAYANSVPVRYDTSGNNLWVYSGAWRSAVQAEQTISYQPGLLTSVVSTKSAFSKFVKTSTVDNIEVSANTFTCAANPIITLYECATDATCASPTTIGTATATASGQAFDGTVSSPGIAAGDYVAWAISAGTCASLDIAATAQIHAN